MKKKILLPLFALMIVWGNNMRADNVISVNQVSIIPGNTTELVVSLENDANFSVYAYDFRLYLPNGIEVATESGDYMYELKGRNPRNAAPNVQQTDDGSIQFGVSHSTQALSGTSGEVLGITLKASEELAEGTYQASIKKITYANKEAQTVHPVDITFDILVTNKVVLDENSTVAPESATGVNVCVLRTINANEWSTICLPFAISETQMQTAFGEDVEVELADFTGYELEYDDENNVVGINVGFNDVNAIEANHPYIIKVSQPVTQITVDGVDVEPDYPGVFYGYETTTGRPPKTVYHPVDFIGTYVADFNFFDDAQSGHAIFLNGNKFWYATESTKHMKAFRAYFDFDDVLPEAENSVKMYFNKDGEPTRINELMPETSDDAIFDLAGRKVEKAGKGIYIVNGKKVLVK